MSNFQTIDFIQVTEKAAIEAARWIGKGDKHAADGAAVAAMRNLLNSLEFSGKIVIGEGKKDEAPELFQGEKVGHGSKPELDIAVDPLECTDSVAYGRYNALTVIATGPKGTLFYAPDTYMDKIAVSSKAKHAIGFEKSIEENIHAVAKALGKNVDEVTVCLLDRERHAQLIKSVRSAGSRVRLITDGDVAAAIATCLPESPIDMLMGIGGSTEAVLAAAALRYFDGEILCRFQPRSPQEKDKLTEDGFNLDKIYTVEDLASGNKITFTATGVIDGPLVPGVVFEKDKIITHSIHLEKDSSSLRYVTTHHNTAD